MKSGFFIALIVSVTYLSETFGQINITGTVSDAKTNEALVGATVQVKQTQTGTGTDADGKFSMEVPSGSNTLVISFLGYVTAEVEIGTIREFAILLEENRTQLNSVIITASRYAQNTFTSPRSMTVASAQEIKDKNQFSALDVFDDRIGIWVEKRTTTTSDPVVRGLSGGNVLALVDAQSLSTFWGEGGFAGDDMYGKIDGESLERIEIVRGPGSVMYGSNALGGVINFITKKSPLDYSDDGFRAGGKLRGASGSASEYLMGRAETWGASKRFKYFIGGTTHYSDDLRDGGGMGYLSPSGGKDWSIDLNTETKINDNNFITLGGQYMNRPEVYRYYRPTQSNSNERLGLNLGYRSTNKTVLFNGLKVNLYHQYKYDERLWYKDSNRDSITQEGFAWWRTYGADVNAVKNIGRKNKNHLVYGVAYHLDVAESPDDEQFTMKTPAGNQKAAPDTKWHNVGIYAQDEWDIVQWLTLSAGVRYDYFKLIADDNVFYTVPGSKDTTKNRALTDPNEYVQHAVTGSAAAVFHLGDHFNIATTYSRGFRMYPPSFGFRQTAQGVLIPNGLLDPVTADLFELGFRVRSKFVDMNVTGYYTMFTNFQSPTFGEYNGSEYIDLNENDTFEPDERVFVNTANGDAYVAGVEAEVEFSLGALAQKIQGLYFSAGAMYNYGRQQFPGQPEEPIRHTHPARGILKLRYEDPKPERKYWIEFVADIVGKFDEVSDARLHSDVGYLEDPQDPTSGLYADYGLPSYQVFDIRGGIKFTRHVYVTLAMENIFDIRYRTAHSRMDASGRNVLVGLELVMPEFKKARKETKL